MEPKLPTYFSTTVPWQSEIQGGYINVVVFVYVRLQLVLVLLHNDLLGRFVQVLLVGIEHARMRHEGRVNVAVTGGILFVPIDRSGEAFFPTHELRPPELVQLVGINGVP